MVSALLYRSKQRGFLELDLLVGMWAQKHVPTMSLQQLRSFSEVGASAAVDDAGSHLDVAAVQPESS